MLKKVVISCLLSNWRRAQEEGSPCLAPLTAALYRWEAQDGRVRVSLLLVREGISALLEGPRKALTPGMAFVVLG